MGDNKNFLLAMLLSMLVIFGWDYYFVEPQRREAEIARQLAEAETQAQTSGAPGQLGAAGAPGGSVAGLTPGIVGRAQALGGAERVAIDTPSVDGSLSLTGGRIDDLLLKRYRETIQPGSPEVTLLTPQGADNAYYAAFGWLGGTNATPGLDTVWSLREGRILSPGAPVVLEWENGAGLRFERRVEVDANYMFTVTDRVENQGAAPVDLAFYGLTARHGVPPGLQNFFILHEGAIGGFDGVIQPRDYKDLDKMEPAAGQPGVRAEEFKAASDAWIGFTDKYWMAALATPPGEAAVTAFRRAGTDAAPVYSAYVQRPTVSLAPGATQEEKMMLFAGAKQAEVIKDYQDRLGIKSFYDSIDWGWFFFLTKPFFALLNGIYKVVGNFGVAILILTVLVKTVVFPLAYKSYASMARMKKLQPQMEALRERHKDDPRAMQMGMMEMYKREKVNPASGCLPIIVQIPIFFALYKTLFVTIEMRHAPFFGWIQDLSAPDPTSLFNLFGLIPWTPPLFLQIGVWPLIMGVTMWLQQQLNPAPPDPIQKKIFNWMPVLFTFMLGTFPAGLVIYWTWNNILTIIQQSLIMKRFGARIELLDNIKALFRRKPKDSTPGAGR
ncbi:membrane protein insertase YidC [Neomegalonema sp.]|uniref:membrane protein insertase YidC n=1 Tax=Neomegalonema sp. TaxID=2039713 RepID=UPI002616F00B|nr:membrane protein insertase YidC [Neomegalonema sp.]MDD2869472.1 membrane protein insertase YidC [Neomegalonema sp.]